MDPKKEIKLVLQTHEIVGYMKKFLTNWEAYHNMKDDKDEAQTEKRILTIVDTILRSIKQIKKDHIIKQFVEEEEHILQKIKLDIKEAKKRNFQEVLKEIITLMQGVVNLIEKEEKALKKVPREEKRQFFRRERDAA